jgi:hypothetical protein
VSITSLASRLAFALFLIVTAFGALPLHAQLERGDTASVEASTNL